MGGKKKECPETARAKTSEQRSYQKGTVVTEPERSVIYLGKCCCTPTLQHTNKARPPDGLLPRVCGLPRRANVWMESSEEATRPGVVRTCEGSAELDRRAGE